MTLELYLLVTGVGAAIALLFPLSVTIGIYLLIIPGLILAMMPSAFLYGLVFGAFRLLLGEMLEGILLDIAALTATAGLMWVIPQPQMRIAASWLDALREDDITPATPIALSGHIYIWQARGKGCDALCAALLKTPGVLSVTRERAYGAAVTYRLVPVDAPGESVKPLGFGLLPKPEYRWDDPLASHRNLQAEWNLMLSSCGLKLVEEEANEKPDFSIIITDGPVDDPAPAHSDQIAWSLRPSEIRKDALEIFDGDGRPLLRRAILSTTVPSAPLLIGTDGGVETFRFQFARKRIGDGTASSAIPREALLLEHTTIARGVDEAAVIGLMRSTIEAALGDPARPAEDAAFKLAEQWMASHRATAQPPDAGERALLVRLLEDRRVASADGLATAVGRIVDPAPDLRRLAAARYLAASDPDKARGWINAMSCLPPGAFATALPEEEEILAAPRTSIHATGLIRRQADRGVAAVPDLLRLLRDFSTYKSGKYRISDTTHAANAVRMAFRAIGPGAASARPEIEALLATPGLAHGYRIEKDDWDVMLVVLGKPVSDLEKPEGLTGTVERYRTRVAERAARPFDPRRDR